MKNKAIYSIIIFLLLAGAALFLYPAFSSWLAEQNRALVIAEYDSAVQEVPTQALDEEWEKACRYNESLIGEPVRDPFLEGSGIALPQNYMEVLSLFDAMGSVEIPIISVNLPIYHGSDSETLEKGAGHLRQTALPIGGEKTHAVLTAHTGLPNAKMFDGLTSLVIGDKFYLHILGRTLAYQVDAINVVKPDEVELLNPIEGEDHVTLLTCTPYGVNSHRLLVRGVRIPYVEEELAKEQEQQRKSGPSLGRQLVIQASVALAVIVVIGVVMVVSGRGKGKREEELPDEPAPPEA